jgi:DNA modification methylase
MTQEKKPNKGNLFGNPLKEDSKRNLNDFFIVKPFSVLHTMEQAWMRRKAYWLNLIENRGKSRESVLFKKSEKETTAIGNAIQSFNDGVSLFDPVLSEAMVRWFSEKGHVVFDPFAGDESRGFVTCHSGRKYVGIELRQEQVDLNLARITEAGMVSDCTYICDSSIETHKYLKKDSVDLVFTCPPYLDLEKYSDDPRDLSNVSYDEFFKLWRNILHQSYNVLKDDRFAVLVISEVRGKDGSYVGFIPKTIEYMEEAGYKYYNDIVLVNNVGTLRFRVGKQMNSGRKIGRLHQNVLVFYKGDPSKIKENFRPIITKD